VMTEGNGRMAKMQDSGNNLGIYSENHATGRSKHFQHYLNKHNQGND